MMEVARRGWLLGVGTSAAAAVLGAPELAWAGSARPLTVQQLVERSDHCAIGTPEHATSQWEDVGGSRRIVTYTRVSIGQPLDGRPPADSELYVRSLGGAVGDIGQIVHGEAQLGRGQQSVLFLARQPDGVFRITGMAQGHYPLEQVQSVQRLQRSHYVAAMRASQDAAIHVLSGKTVAEAESLVAQYMPHAR